MRWDPAQYQRFTAERGAAFRDLLSRVGHPNPRRVVDLGCGPGTATVLLAQRWPGAQVEGIDSSPQMIARAGSLARPGLRFTVADLAGWRPPADADVVVSNAALHWVPDHRALLGQWAGQLPPGGWLAVQVPGNFAAASHALLRELVAAPRWATLLSGVLPPGDPVGTPVEYAQLLLAAGLGVQAWETTYLHLLPGPDPVLQWMRGAALRPVLAALSPVQAGEFEAEYAAALREAYPGTEHGVPFAFRRVFAVGHRA